MDNREQLERAVEAFARREEIQAGRPLAWGAQAGLAALAATALWLIARGADLDTVLVRAVASLVLFGAAGYAAGRLLERAPSPPPITGRQQGRAGAGGGGRGTRAEALRPGMVLAEAVRGADGEILIPEGAELSEAHLEVIREYGIPDAVVKSAEEGEEHDDQGAGK